MLDDLLTGSFILAKKLKEFTSVPFQQFHLKFSAKDYFWVPLKFREGQFKLASGFYNLIPTKRKVSKLSFLIVLSVIYALTVVKFVSAKYLVQLATS